MRIFLDAHISGRRVGSNLRRLEHDVRAIDEEQALEGLSDSDLLELATRDSRVLATFNVRDFVPLLVEWAAFARDHAGVLLVPSSIRHQEFGLIASGMHVALSVTMQNDWRNRVAWVRRD